MEARLNSALNAAVQSKEIPSVAAIAMDAAGNILYRGAFGTTDLGDPNAPPYTPSTITMMWSCTKIVACVAALQLFEQGKLKLDDLVEKYVPAIQDIPVLEGFKEDGEPILRPAKKKPTILNLMTHSSGFSYDFFDKNTFQWRVKQNQGVGEYVAVGSKSCLNSPLQFEPGSKFQYGVSIDWVGFVVEAISGMTLNEYIQKNILEPLGLKNTGSHYEEGAPRLVVHLRGEDDSLVSHPEIKAALSPEVYGGGHYLYSTLDDFSNFLLTLLNYGTHPKSGVKILNEATVKEYIFGDQLSKICSPDGVGVVKDVPVPALSNEGEFLPGIRKVWSCGLMINTEPNPHGRREGSGAWAGLGNIYFWVDPKGGKVSLDNTVFDQPIVFFVFLFFSRRTTVFGVWRPYEGMSFLPI